MGHLMSCIETAISGIETVQKLMDNLSTREDMSLKRVASQDSTIMKAKTEYDLTKAQLDKARERNQQFRNTDMELRDKLAENSKDLIASEKYMAAAELASQRASLELTQAEDAVRGLYQTRTRVQQEVRAALRKQYTELKDVLH